MLILVAVSVQILINSNIIGMAENTADKTKTAYEEEKNMSKVVINGAEYESLDEYEQIKEKGSVTKVIVKEQATNTNLNKASVKEVLQTKTTIATYEAPIPVGFTISGIESEQRIDEGLVIYLIDDKTEEEIAAIDWTDATRVAELQQTYDQFVWIPVEDINEMYMCQSEGTDTDGSGTVENDEYNTCKITVQEVEGEKVAYCTTHGSTLMAGRLYTTSTGENFNAELTTQKYTANSGLREPDVVTSYDGNTTYLGYLNAILGTSYSSSSDFKTALQNEYNEIVKSVYENGGFYVGRYETSNMTTTDGTAIKVVAGTTTGISKIIWYYMYAQQKDYATNKGLAASVGSTMIQGASYDQVMKFVNTASYSVTTAGNVGHGKSYFTTYPYQTGGRDYSTNYTGTVEYNDISKNIFDLEGNVFAWSTEASNTCCRVIRGAYWDHSYSACYLNDNRPYSSDTACGSVSQLYVK